MSALCQKQTSRRFRKRHPSCRELSPDCAFVGVVSASQTSFTPGLKLNAPAYEPGKILSLSFFRDEAAVRAWRTTNEHRVAQVKGRGEIFSNYRLRVAGIIRDYGMLEREQVPSDSREVHPAQVAGSDERQRRQSLWFFSLGTDAFCQFDSNSHTHTRLVSGLRAPTCPANDALRLPDAPRPRP